MVKHQIVGNVSASVEDIIGYLKGTSKDKLIKSYYDKQVAMGDIVINGGEEQFKSEKIFLHEMSVVRHLLHWPLVRVIAISKKKKRSLKREITAAVRFLGTDGKEHIRFTATYSCYDVDGLPTIAEDGIRVSGHCSGIGVWE
jgi:hypothetical protein